MPNATRTDAGHLSALHTQLTKRSTDAPTRVTMPTDLRAKAAAHQRRLDAEATFYTVGELAALLGCVPASVRAIPFARLPYTTIGRGAKRRHRRYDPADVAAYRASRGQAA